MKPFISGLLLGRILHLQPRSRRQARPSGLFCGQGRRGHGKDKVSQNNLKTALSFTTLSFCRHRLYELEAALGDSPSGGAPHRGLIAATIRRYVEIDGFSAHNYFVVNRKLVTSILGYLSTYIVVLVQFKIADLHKRDDALAHNKTDGLLEQAFAEAEG